MKLELQKTTLCNVELWGCLSEFPHLQQSLSNLCQARDLLSPLKLAQMFPIN